MIFGLQVCQDVEKQFSEYLKELTILEKNYHIDGDSFRSVFNDLGYSTKIELKIQKVCKLVNF